MNKSTKNELGHRHGDFMVIAYTTAREPSNGCVMWLCECIHCGQRVLRNGNNLRFRQTIHCPNCNFKNHKRR